MPSFLRTSHAKRVLLSLLAMLACLLLSVPFFSPAHAHPIDPDTLSSTPYHVLFDNAHAETAGNADWVISSSQPDPLGENPNPQQDTDWTGGISSWGIALQKSGRYSLETSTSALSYGSSSNALDLSHFNALILPEPNSLFSSSEKTAIMTFVKNGGGLFMIADHKGSDRNNDGYDSLHVLNDLMNNSGAGNDPFGIQFDDLTIKQDYPHVDPNLSDPILQGPFGTGTTSLINEGTTETINATDNPNVVGVVYTSGTTSPGNSNVFIARSTYGSGRVIAEGDSSAIDDGTCASGNTCYNGWGDPNAQDNILFPNGTEWLASSGTGTPGATDTPVGSTTGTPVVTSTPTGIGTPATTPTATSSPVSSSLPRFDHVVVVIEENKDYAELIGPNTGAPYINQLAGQGMLFTNSHALTHPSQPNYLELYSGSNQGKTDDSCSSSTVFPKPDLGSQLLDSGNTFAGYSESMPSAGFTDCNDTPLGINALYARKHNPWVNFSETSGPKTNLTFASFPSTAATYAQLPTVSFVVPNLQDDMHDGSIQQGDTWLQQHLDGYAQWAKTHNSLLIVTSDEEDTTNGVESNPNQIMTFFVGEHVQVGSSALNINHYSVLRTLEDMYGLAPANNAASATAITGIWN